MPVISRPLATWTCAKCRQPQPAGAEAHLVKDRAISPVAGTKSIVCASCAQTSKEASR